MRVPDDTVRAALADLGKRLDGVAAGVKIVVQEALAVADSERERRWQAEAELQETIEGGIK
jgi:hypothetical protein